MAGRPFRCQRGLAKSYHNRPTAGGLDNLARCNLPETSAVERDTDPPFVKTTAALRLCMSAIG
jgi:hypothetical protein